MESTDVFEFVNTIVPHASLSESELDDFDLFLVGCNCDYESPCSESESCSCRIQSPLSYTGDGRLHPAFLTDAVCPPIIECGGNCSCSSKCSNRLLSVIPDYQTPPEASLGSGDKSCEHTSPGLVNCPKTCESGSVKISALPVGTTSPTRSRNSYCKDVIRLGLNQKIKCQLFSCGEKGMGLRAMAEIDSGEFVSEYAGEVISSSEAKLRSALFPVGTYLFAVHESSDLFKRTTLIDARFKGNYARFINHSCDPNLLMLPVRVDIIVPRLVFFAKRKINVGEELTVDYGQGEKSNGLSDTKCCCLSGNCRKYLPINLTLDKI